MAAGPGCGLASTRVRQFLTRRYDNGNESYSPPQVSVEDLQWFDCNVTGAGPGEDGTIWVRLTSTGGEFTQVWFTALPAIKQQVLQTALTALQTN